MIIYGNNNRFSINDYDSKYGEMCRHIKITDAQGRELETYHNLDNAKCEETIALYRTISSNVSDLTWCDIIEVLAHKEILYDFNN